MVSLTPMSVSTEASATAAGKRAASQEPVQDSENKRQKVSEEQPDAVAGPSEYSLAYRLSQIPDGVATERHVGITSYVNPDLPAFEHAIIKHRFTDFHVWEIAKGGRVVRLKDISRPITSAAAITSTSDENAQTDTAAAEQLKQQEEEVIPQLKDLVSEEKVQEIQAFFDKGKTPETEGASILMDPITEKDKRKAFHGALRAAFEGKLSSEVQAEGIIKVTWGTGEGKERRSIRPSKVEQRNLPPFVQFTLHKTNRETQDCIGQLSSRLGVTPRDITTAGTKDKRGVTTQLMTLKRGKRTLEEVWDTVNGLHHGRSKDRFASKRGRGNAHKKGGSGFLGREGMMPQERGERGVRIGDLEYAQTPLDLGMLDGNRFCIVLRDVRVPSEDVIDKAIQTLQQQGFINYYGMQRFGNSTVPTHLIGLALLQSNWKEAARLILSEKSGDSEDVIAARRAWTIDGDAEKSLRNMPKWAVAERCMLEFYKNQRADTNHNGALARIPKNLRMMYVHAYQSYVWNSVVSERMRMYGCEAPVVGDIVLNVPEDAVKEAVEIEDGDEKDEPAVAPEAQSGGKITKQSLLAASKTPKVKVLTEEDLPKYTIYDVVLPLPGFSVTYPTGQTGELYKKMLEADGLDINNLFRPQKEYSLGGQYRKILKRPNNLTWSKIRYSDANRDLIQSDEDALLGMEAPSSEDDGEKLAIRLEFDLDSAAYATMALREVLKSETGNMNQRALTEAVLDTAAKEKEDAKVELEASAGIKAAPAANGMKVEEVQANAPAAQPQDAQMDGVDATQVKPL